MKDLRVAYIRPTQRSRRQAQEGLVTPYKPDRIWVAREHSLDDVIQIMQKAGRVLIVPTLDTIAERRAERIAVIDAVLGAGSMIIEAMSGTEITPDNRDVVMATLGMKRKDLSYEDAVRAGKEGGAKGYSIKELEDCKKFWTNDKLTGSEISELTGISYATLWRYFTRTRVEKVKRGRGAGRR